MSPARAFYFAIVSTLAASIATFMYFKMKNELGIMPLPFGAIAVVFGVVAVGSIAYLLVVLTALRASERRGLRGDFGGDLREFCRGCGAEIMPEFDYCPRCGEKA